MIRFFYGAIAERQPFGNMPALPATLFLSDCRIGRKAMHATLHPALSVTSIRHNRGLASSGR
jgi:hypothetical protein